MDNKRKHIRFEPDENTLIMLKIDNDEVHTGLCVSESQGGCSAVFINHVSFVAGKMVYIKVGKLDSMSAEIRWVTELDSDAVKIGFQYLS